VPVAAAYDGMTSTTAAKAAAVTHLMLLPPIKSVRSMSRKAAHCLRWLSIPFPDLFDFGARAPLYDRRNVSTPDSRIYVGRLDEGLPAVYAVDATNVYRLLPHAEGFVWGQRAGDAALELARTLLTDAGSGEPPEEACRLFSEQILARLPHDGFALQRDTVNSWLRRYVTV